VLDSDRDATDNHAVREGKTMLAISIKLILALGAGLIILALL
jgi:hypothetical protein